MYYVISDSEGNTVDSFRDEREAEQSLLVTAAKRPEDEHELLLLAHDDSGEPVGPARLAVDVREERAAAALERARDEPRRLRARASAVGLPSHTSPK